jgi:murein DD-endopeptidase MepM/ murein hydrolase activator NlpD
LTRTRLALLAALALASCATEQHPPPPVVNEAPPAAAATGLYVVQQGDTIYSVARALHLSVRALIDSNQLQAPYQLQPGQRLVLPGGGFYEVVKGDSLSIVARKTGVAFATLARINGLSAPYLLQPGQRLQLPASAAAALPPGSTLAAPAPGKAAAAPRASKPAPSAVPAAPPPAPVPQTAPVAAQTAPAAAQPAPAATPVAAAPAPLPPPPAKSGHGFIWPVKGEVIAEFGNGGKGQHNDGINIAAPRGTPVIASESGVVAYAGNELRGFGNLLLIKHEDGVMTAYAHNDQLLVKRGDLVKRGQKIATVGDSGGVAQPQLHFELRQGTRPIDPGPVLAGKAVPASSQVEPPEPG